MLDCKVEASQKKTAPLLLDFWPSKRRQSLSFGSPIVCVYLDIRARTDLFSIIMRLGSLLYNHSDSCSNWRKYIILECAKNYKDFDDHKHQLKGKIYFWQHHWPKITNDLSLKLKIWKWLNKEMIWCVLNLNFRVLLIYLQNDYKFQIIWKYIMYL